MKVVLIVPPNFSTLTDRLEPHLGLLYIAAVLLENNYEVEYGDLAGIPEEEWEVPESDIYGITVYGVTLNNARKLASRCKRKNPKSLVVVGGPQITGQAKETLDMETNFDCGIIGEGEFGLLSAIKDWGKQKIYRESVPDLNALPLPARHLADFNTYTRIVYGKPSISLLTQRGCPYNCYMCANDRLFGPVRQRLVEKVGEEIKHLIRTYNCHNFYFHDNIISTNLRRFEALLGVIKPLNIIWFAFDDCRKILSVEEYRRWYDAGCRVLFLGVESGSDYMLKLMNKKGQTKEKIVKIVRNVEAAGIEARCGLLFGFPGERRETWEETKRMIEDLQPAQVFINYFVPFVGSEVFKRPQDFGITEMDKDFEHHTLITKDGYSKATFSTKLMSRGEWNELVLETGAWWKNYVKTHPAKGSPAWTQKIFRRP